MWHARQQTQQAQHATRNEQRALVAAHLLGQLLRKVVFGGHARYQNTRRRRNDQGRHLRHQTIANGERAVQGKRFAEAQVVRNHPDDQAANQIDDQNQDASNGIAPHKLRRTVHRAKKVSLLRHLGPPLLGFLLLDEARIQVGIDGHLLAGHRIQGKTGRNLRHPARTLGNHHKVDDGDQDKNDHPYREIAPNEELAKSLNHLAGGVCAGVAF